ncbi:hypothetical protein BGW42_005468 [Actinomortierella wolfii]|nr:hypothetical protein BGW42_005468 [Actinomortierella wolfii]
MKEIVDDPSDVSRILKDIERRLPDVKIFNETIRMIVKALMPDVYRPRESDPAFVKVLMKLSVLVTKLSTSGLALALIHNTREIPNLLNDIRQELCRLPNMSLYSVAQIIRVNAVAERRDAENVEIARNKLSRIHSNAKKLLGSFKLREQDMQKFYLDLSQLRVSDNLVARDDISKTTEGVIIDGKDKGELVHVKKLFNLNTNVTVITQCTTLITHLFRLCENIARPRYVIPKDHLIIMDPIMHMTLEEVLKAGIMTDARKVYTALSIAGALVLVHSLKVVHRSIKSSNVLMTILDKDGQMVCQPKLTGFENCRILYSKNFIGKTKPESVMYAPEIANGYGSTLMTDVFAFGVMMYEISMGKLPEMQGLWVKESDIDTWLVQEYGSLSESYSALLYDCISFDYTSRPTMQEVAERLAEIANELSDK